ncbi:hypothetical protein V7S43_006647 [Phytophthora oleae]|uniref:Uncharacterized protein n=1 Tax=Phytophthora oleae TaxID=2107226 RepID=A0ABD3FNS5_9STRA
MSFVLTLREMECIQFDSAPAVLMAFYSKRMGSRGLSILHFRSLSVVKRLNRGSSNTNFTADFGATAALPQTPPTLQDFVLDNQAADAANDPSRVTLTLQYVNVYIGSALGHLADDSQQWWRNFIVAVSVIDFQMTDEPTGTRPSPKSKRWRLLGLSSPN